MEHKEFDIENPFTDSLAIGKDSFLYSEEEKLILKMGGDNRKNLIIEKTSKAAKTLENLYNKFVASASYSFKVNDFVTNPSTLFAVDPLVLLDVAKHFLYDMERICAFHKDVQIPDQHKVGGYLTYWLCKLRPVRVQNMKLYEKAGASQLKKLKRMNEQFAFWVGLNELNCRNSSNREKNITIPRYGRERPSFVDTFVYSLRYRPCTGDNLAMVFYFIEELAGVSKELERVKDCSGIT